MKKPEWQNLAIGGISEGGSGEDFETGDWRDKHPLIDKKKCKNCLNCFVYCPDNAIKVENEKIHHVDYLHCKGCGICAQECPNKAITMIEEKK